MERDTSYGLLASLRGRLFRDADFAELYCLANGRTSVPPSLLALAAVREWDTLVVPNTRPAAKVRPRCLHQGEMARQSA